MIYLKYRKKNVTHIGLEFLEIVMCNSGLVVVVVVDTRRLKSIECRPRNFASSRTYERTCGL